MSSYITYLTCDLARTQRKEKSCKIISHPRVQEIESDNMRTGNKRWVEAKMEEGRQKERNKPQSSQPSHSENKCKAYWPPGTKTEKKMLFFLRWDGEEVEARLFLGWGHVWPRQCKHCRKGIVCTGLISAINAGTKYVHNYSYGIMQANAIKGRQFSTALYYTYAIYTRANPKQKRF